MPRVVMARVDYNLAHQLDKPVCWVCRQPWPHAMDLVLDAENRELRVDGGGPKRTPPSVGSLLFALINAFPRYLTRSQLTDAIYDDRPDADIPDRSSVLNAMRKARSLLAGSQYTIEYEKLLGYRLVSEEILQREALIREAELPKRTRVDLSEISAQAISKTRGAMAKSKSTRVKKNGPGLGAYKQDAAPRPKKSKNTFLKRRSKNV